MNIKYYLRGLGIGMIVTALILGVHFNRTSKNAVMTDKEIIARATELGMVDGNSRLVEKIDDEKTTDELLKEIEEAGLDNTTSSNEDLGETQDNDVTDVTNNEEDVENTSNVDDSADLGEESDETQENNIVIDETTIDPVIDAEDDPDKQTNNIEETTETNNSGKSVTLTISSGDSSYRVADKLAKLGVVDDASDYDAYLCSHGYDRYIRTGTYVIYEDNTNEDIAKMITHK